MPSIVVSEGQYKPGSCTIKTETKLPQNFKTKHFGEFSLVIPYIVYIYQCISCFNINISKMVCEVRVSGWDTLHCGEFVFF